MPEEPVAQKPNDSATEPPKPEMLQSPADDDVVPPESATPGSPTPTAPGTPKPPDSKRRRGTYRPSHRATFIGLSVVVGILALNAVIIGFVINGKTGTSSTTAEGSVTLNSKVLNSLGVSRNSVGTSGEELVVGPDSRFNGKLTVGGDVSIAGQLTLNNTLNVTTAKITTLQAGDTAVNQLNVNGDGTISTLNLRKDLVVAGSSTLQGPVTFSQLLTADGSVNIVGNLSVGGTLSTRSFEASSLVSDTTLTIGGHIITSGSTPSLAKGSALRGTDTVSISGNDAAGTVTVNIGAGSISAGCVAQVAFHSQYSNAPSVALGAIGNATVYLSSRSVAGFTICVSNSLSNASYSFDYIVEQ